MEIKRFSPKKRKDYTGGTEAMLKVTVLSFPSKGYSRRHKVGEGFRRDVSPVECFTTSLDQG
ncbi:hypothetical protein [Photorhabdus caribbeanensis]|uniref:hypothetical protein n=1 Tax=Photorhabdus caribbeanensis TaxID=1004165 RepID=UPI001BD53ECA|nr:hypothetical protein [Photorhabdus caribbeanensis]